ncbi:MAG: ROK family protein [Candidatus Sericytochromatia bacterium]|nr:ROK family protein [Candidatus Sericytochromatia bacterium]
MSASTSAPILGIDLGGTKVHLRMALGAEVLLDVRVPTAGHSGLEELVQVAIGTLRPSAVAVGIAGPVDGRKAHVTNVGWDLDADRLAAALDGCPVLFANDMALVAHGLATLGSEERHTLQEGQRDPAGACLVIGAGTGMGTGLFVPGSNGTPDRYLAGEGGHMTWAPSREEDSALWRWLRERFGHVSVERVASGTGLAALAEWAREEGQPLAGNVTRALAEGRGVAAALVAAAEAGTCRTSKALLDRFLRIFGTAVGNAALTALPTGGIYLAGGVAQKLEKHLVQGGGFLEAMTDKGRMQHLIEQLHVSLVTADDVAIRGALVLARSA